MSFNHEGHYKCICGREFTKSQSYNAHLSNCRIHLGEERYKNRLKQYNDASSAGLLLIKENVNKKRLNNEVEWNSSEHFCETCNKKVITKYASGRFCSLECARAYSHKNKITLEKLEIEQLPINTGSVKKFLLNNNYKQNKCEICGVSEWNGKPIACQLHHIDGNNKNNKLSNLQMLCPNCHSQTDNYAKKK